MLPVLATATALVARALAALFANYVVKAVLVRLLNRVLAYTAYGRDPELRRDGFIERLEMSRPRW
jgi:miniconductance mechanosensitive channel